MSSKTETVIEIPLVELLAFEAPYLIDRLIKYCIVRTGDEGELLLKELIKYMVLCRSDEGVPWQMHSLLIDEVWHQFVLYTDAYGEFCDRYLGGYFGHSPANAPNDSPPRDAPPTFIEFRDRYESFFGEALHDVWYDETNVQVWRRVFNLFPHEWRCKPRGDLIDVSRVGEDVVASYDRLAEVALKFVAQTGAFYVRELPGDLTDEEKVGLISSLVHCRLLRIGP